MRITIEIPHALHLALKAKARQESCSIRELILRGVEIEIYSLSKETRRRVKLPLIRSKRAGTLKLDNRRIYNLITFP